MTDTDIEPSEADMEVIPLLWSKLPTGKWCGCAITHVYRIEEYTTIDFHVYDNQNGWDCFSKRSTTLEGAKARATEHFKNLILSTIKSARINP